MKSSYKTIIEDLSNNHPIRHMILYFFAMIGSFTIVKDIAFRFDQILFDKIFIIYFVSLFTAVFMVFFQRLRSRKIASAWVLKYIGYFTILKGRLNIYIIAIYNNVFNVDPSTNVGWFIYCVNAQHSLLRTSWAGSVETEVRKTKWSSEKRKCYSNTPQSYLVGLSNRWR